MPAKLSYLPHHEYRPLEHVETLLSSCACSLVVLYEGLFCAKNTSYCTWNVTTFSVLSLSPLVRPSPLAHSYASRLSAWKALVVFFWIVLSRSLVAHPYASRLSACKPLVVFFWIVLSRSLVFTVIVAPTSYYTLYPFCRMASAISSLVALGAPLVWMLRNLFVRHFA